MVNSTSGTVAAPAMFSAMRRTKSSVCSWTSASPLLVELSRLLRQCGQALALRLLGGAREVGEPLVVAGEAVERTRQWVGVECRCQEIRRQVIRSHGFGNYPSREQNPGDLHWCEWRAAASRGTPSPARVKFAVRVQRRPRGLGAPAWISRRRRTPCHGPGPVMTFVSLRRSARCCRLSSLLTDRQTSVDADDCGANIAGPTLRRWAADRSLPDRP